MNFTTILQGNVALIHHSTSSVITIKLVTREPNEDGTWENKIQELWLDYTDFENLKKAINQT